MVPLISIFFLIFTMQLTNASVCRYDYIIVGGGAAGCSLAATLSQRFKVLLLERGGSPYNDPNITRIENFTPNFLNQGENTPVQPFTSLDGVSLVQARVLGGGTCINGGIYSRANPQFIDTLNLNKAAVNASYEWVERALVSFPDSIRPFQAAFFNSLLEVGITPNNGRTYDHLLGTKYTGSIFDNNGTRHPASDLLLRYANRENIKVVLHSRVQKVLFNDTTAVGVLYLNVTDGTYHNAFLNSNVKSQVILSAGALNSPQLLMLSGIGPREHLQSMGIPLILNSPRVGKGMVDNPSAQISIRSPTPPGLTQIQVTGITPDNVFYANQLFQDGTIFEKVVDPVSSGELYLRNLNTSDPPLVRFNYYKEAVDVERCVDGVDILEKVLLSASLSAFRFGNQTLPSGGTVSSPVRANVTVATIRSNIAKYCKEKVTTVYHYYGGCRPNEVIDSNYNVIGVSRLRVVDGSTFVKSPGTNPQATLMMLGRYLGLKMILNH